jgi:lipopolysaccharide/colanic/teichoic acid biosynthesis glycosyltransferase
MSITASESPRFDPPLKRLLDLGLAGLGLALSAPVWLVIALAIKLYDGGPVFYRQVRVGRYGQPFTSWKFRSMVPHADAIAPGRQASANDARITPVGRWLRATALDELPQLWSIFVGDMSFVGPRALLPAEIETRGSGELIPAASIPGYAARHRVTPGLTGVAQIYADRDIPRRDKFRYDLVYVRRRSVWLDVRLIALSVWITLRGKWEYRGDKLARPAPPSPVSRIGAPLPAAPERRSPHA